MTEPFGNRILPFVTGHETTTNAIGDGVATYPIGRRAIGRNENGRGACHEARSLSIRLAHAQTVLSTRAGVQRFGLLARKPQAVYDG